MNVYCFDNIEIHNICQTRNKYKNVILKYFKNISCKVRYSLIKNKLSIKIIREDIYWH